jgi:hypothetical protein
MPPFQLLWGSVFVCGEISADFDLQEGSSDLLSLKRQTFFLEQICRIARPNGRWFVNCLSVNSKPIVTHGEQLELVRARLQQVDTLTH